MNDSVAQEKQLAQRKLVSRLCKVYESDYVRGQDSDLSAYLSEVQGTGTFDVLLLSLLSTRASLLKRPVAMSELKVLFPEYSESIQRLYHRLSAEQRLPNLLGDYEVVSLIADGGQARVLRARKANGGFVAIKISSTSTGRLRLQGECLFLERLHHKNIVSFLDSGTEGDQFYLVMPELQGTNLQDVNRLKLSHKQIATILFQLCNAVAFVHSTKILHRDIKPANIHLDSRCVVRLLDFGMAIDRSTGLGPNREIVEFHGTPQFMAPEQARGDLGNDERGDLFAIGATLFWLLEGKPPYASLDDAKNAKYSISLTAKPVNKLHRICNKAIQPDVADRYSDIAELLSDLTDAFPSLKYRPLVIRIGLFAVAVILAVVGLWSLPQSQADAPPRWLVDRAAEMGIELRQISPKDFRYRFENPSLLGGFRKNPDRHGDDECQVQIECQPARALGLRLQLDFGNGWLEAENLGDKEYQLSLKGLNNFSGEVNARLVSPKDKGSFTMGPFVDVVSIRDEIETSSQTKLLMAKTAAVQSIEQLVEYDFESPQGWTLTTKYLEQYRYLIDRLIVDRWIEVPFDRASKAFRDPSYSIIDPVSVRKNFEAATETLRKRAEPQPIHIQIHWIDGEISQFDTSDPPSPNSVGGMF